MPTTHKTANAALLLAALLALGASACGDGGGGSTPKNPDRPPPLIKIPMDGGTP